ncbi:hypothetical protein [Candidatus Lokiarchaeum ossiferum]
MISRSLFPEDRGKTIGLSIGLALFFTSIITMINYSFNLKPEINLNILILVWIGIAIFGMVILWRFFRWKEPKSIHNLSPKIREKIIPIFDKNVIFTISAVSIFFIGNGIAHSLILAHLRIDSTCSLRALSFIISGSCAFIFGWLSDKGGRYLIFLMAIISTLISMFIGIYLPFSVISLLFEVTGYYLILEFGVLKIADITPPRLRFLYSGLTFGISFIFDFIGSLIGGFFDQRFEIYISIWISISILIISFLLILIVPHTLLKMGKANAIFIVSPSGIMLYSKGKFDIQHGSPKELVGALIHAINSLAETIFIKGSLKSIEFEGISLVVLSSEDKFLFSILVATHNRNLRNRLILLRKFILDDECLSYIRNVNLTAEPDKLEILREKFRIGIHKFFPEIENDEEINSI